MRNYWERKVLASSHPHQGQGTNLMSHSDALYISCLMWNKYIVEHYSPSLSTVSLFMVLITANRSPKILHEKSQK